jgi:coenzyme F420 hydrogenase subunit beta
MGRLRLFFDGKRLKSVKIVTFFVRKEIFALQERPPVVTRPFKMQIFGPKELLEDVHQRNLCVGCGACVDLCPYFKFHKGKTAMLFPCELSQGRCYAYCPKTEVDLDALSERWWGKAYEGDPLGQHLAVLKVRAGEKAPHGVFQAGGTVSSLMAFSLDQGLIDGAVLTDREGLFPLPRLVRSAEDVALCATSKYTAAPSLSALNRALRDGCKRIGVVGTPCQMTAVEGMRSNPLDKPGFVDPVTLAVGLFCTWALDTRNLMSLLSKRLDLRKIRKMDIPPPPAEVFVIQTDENTFEIALSEIRPLILHGCSVCSDMTAEWADISVGNLEGEPHWNTLIVRTTRGRDLVDRASRARWITTDPIRKENLHHLRLAAKNKKKRGLKAAMQEGILNSRGRSCLRVNAGAVEKILADESDRNPLGASIGRNV